MVFYTFIAALLVHTLLSVGEKPTGYISSKTRRIWTELVTVMGNGESDPIKISVRSLQQPQRKEQNINLFRDEYHAPVWSLLLYRFPQTLQEYRNLCAGESFCSEILNFFPLRGSLFSNQQTRTHLGFSLTVAVGFALRCRF